MPFIYPLGSRLLGPPALLKSLVSLLHSQQLTEGAIGIQREGLDAMGII